MSRPGPVSKKTRRASTPMTRDYPQELSSLPKENDFFIGIDSDGCVFDSMEVKHKECFCPAYIKHFGLQAASRYAREIWDFVNLYSKTRGCNRFLALRYARELIRNRPVFAERGIETPALTSLDAWVEEETKLGNPALKARVEASGDEELTRLLAWSEEVNARIKDMVYGVGPFSRVRPCLEQMKGRADVIVVSQTPMEALEREWEEHDLAGYVNYIAGQEAGTKTEHLRYAAGNRYDAGKVLMIGDAPGDYQAAAANNALFFPVLPGDEESSWQKLHDEGLKRFFDGAFDGDYQAHVLEEFDAALPETPPWT